MTDTVVVSLYICIQRSANPPSVTNIALLTLQNVLHVCVFTPCACMCVYTCALVAVRARTDVGVYVSLGSCVCTCVRVNHSLWCVNLNCHISENGICMRVCVRSYFLGSTCVYMCV